MSDENAKKVRYSIINKKHPCYDADYIKKANILYAGRDIKKHANMFIKRLSNENPEIFKERIDCLYYKNHMSSIINSIIAELLENSISIELENQDSPNGDFYSDLQCDMDLCGSNIRTFVRTAVQYSLLQGESYAIINYPELDYVNKYEQEMFDRPWIRFFKNEAVINYKTDEFGNLNNLIVKYVKNADADMLSEDDFYIDVFEHYYIKDNNVYIDVYESDKYKSQRKDITLAQERFIKASMEISYGSNSPYMNQQQQSSEYVSLVSSTLTRFSKLPIIKLKIPQSLCLGNELVPMSMQFIERYSALISAQNRCLVPIPVIKRGPMEDKKINPITTNSDRLSNIKRDVRITGQLVMGDRDELVFAQPDSSSFELVDKQLKELVDDMYKVAHAAASSIKSSAKIESAAAKQIDKKATRIIVSELATVLKEWIIELFEFIAEYRGDEEQFTVSGLDINSEKMTRAEVLEESLNILNINIPSKTFVIENMKRLAFATLSNTISKETAKQIDAEIKESIEKIDCIDDIISIKKEVEPNLDPNQDPNLDDENEDNLK